MIVLVAVVGVGIVHRVLNEKVPLGKLLVAPMSSLVDDETLSLQVAIYNDLPEGEHSTVDIKIFSQSSNHFPPRLNIEVKRIWVFAEGTFWELEKPHTIRKPANYGAYGLMQKNYLQILNYKGPQLMNNDTALVIVEVVNSSKQSSLLRSPEISVSKLS